MTIYDSILFIITDRGRCFQNFSLKFLLNQHCKSSSHPDLFSVKTLIKTISIRKSFADDFEKKNCITSEAKQKEIIIGKQDNSDDNDVQINIQKL